MKHVITIGTAALLLCACQPAAKPAEEAETASAETSASAAGFTIGSVTYQETGIEGCSVALRSPGQTGDQYSFLFGSEDKAAKGFIRIDDQLVTVIRSADSFDETKMTGQDVFASADGVVSVTHDYHQGEGSEGMDGAPLTSTLTVTDKGVTQTLTLSGTSAC